MNLGSEWWDEDILQVIGVTPDRLPDVAGPGRAIGTLTPWAADALGLNPGTVVGAGAQDQYCAALGANAIAPGDVLLSTGTAWVMLSVADAPYEDPAGGIGNGRHLSPGLWGHFGEVSNGGVSLEWARTVLNHGDHEPLPVGELDEVLAGTRRGADGLSFFPFFDGTSPYDSLETSRGSLLGVHLNHGYRHVLRAVAEGVVFAMRMLIDGYYASTGRTSGAPVVVGGATRSREWMRILADVLDTDLLVSSQPDAASVGAAILAAVAADHDSDAPAAARRMASPRSRVVADGPASADYAALFATYTRDADALSELYATRAGLSETEPV
jgi:xylulokinase